MLEWNVTKPHGSLGMEFCSYLGYIGKPRAIFCLYQSAFFDVGIIHLLAWLQLLPFKLYYRSTVRRNGIGTWGHVTDWARVDELVADPILLSSYE